MADTRKTVKIRVYTRTLVTFLRYRKVGNCLVFDKAITELFHVEPDGQVDQLFPIPLTWNGTVDELTNYIYKASSVMLVDTNACLITVRI